MSRQATIDLALPPPPRDLTEEKLQLLDKAAGDVASTEEEGGQCAEATYKLMCCGTAGDNQFRELLARIIAPTERQFLTVDNIARSMQAPSRELRYRNFKLTGDAAKRDDFGWWFLSKVPPEIDAFQNDQILPALMAHTVRSDPRGFVDILRTRAFNHAPSWMVWENLTDERFDDIFANRFGAEMIRKPTEAELAHYDELFKMKMNQPRAHIPMPKLDKPTWGKKPNAERTPGGRRASDPTVREAGAANGLGEARTKLQKAKSAVGAGMAAAGKEIAVVDITELLRDVERKRTTYPTPSCKIFFSAHGGLHARAIVMYHVDGTTETYVRDKSETWHFAKRAAMASVLYAHQIGVHLVHGHLLCESMMVLAYKYLDPKHFFFKWLEPLAADVQFINESWGLGLILYGTIMEMGPITSDGIIKLVENAKTNAFEGDLTWDIIERLKPENSGVPESCKWNWRTTARVVAGIVRELATAVVDRFYDPNDAALAEFLSQCYWWRHTKTGCTGTRPAKPGDSQAGAKKQVINLMVEFYMNASYRHDYSHDDFLWRACSYLPPMLQRNVDPERPETYLPSKSIYAMNLQVTHALQAGVIETPLEGYPSAYGGDAQLKPAVDSFVHDMKALLAVANIQGEKATHGHMNQCGSMTH
mmetsp:Transcript_12513/g.33478  ORF Transcript_12513/g.33478 Transcript_12513/m.33478 type:complete len:647 (+) Transcript_12513:74-2014(+)